MKSTKLDTSLAFDLNGAMVYKSFLDKTGQQALVSALRLVVARAPLFSPMTPYGRNMSVRMTSAGRYGWFSDRSGYRYVDKHPSGNNWPAIPQEALDIWQAVSGENRLPDCCLVNFYGEGARMGMHQDKDEADFTCPVDFIGGRGAVSHRWHHAWWQDGFALAGIW